MRGNHFPCWLATGCRVRRQMLCRDLIDNEYSTTDGARCLMFYAKYGLSVVRDWRGRAPLPCYYEKFKV